MATPEEPPRAVAHDGLVDALVQASFVTMAVLSKVGAEYDLSLTQLRVLGDPAGPAGQDDQAGRLPGAGEIHHDRAG